MIVADASAVVDVLINAPAAPNLRARLFAQGDSIHAPHLLDIEVIHALRRRFLVGEMSLQHAERAIALFQMMPIRRYDHQVLIARIWQHRANLTAYDATYVALAELLDTIVLTTDARLAAAPGMSRRVNLVT